jgi:hypothetical protein
MIHIQINDLYIHGRSWFLASDEGNIYISHPISRCRFNKSNHYPTPTEVRKIAFYICSCIRKESYAQVMRVSGITSWHSLRATKEIVDNFKIHSNPSFQPISASGVFQNADVLILAHPYQFQTGSENRHVMSHGSIKLHHFPHFSPWAMTVPRSDPDVVPVVACFSAIWVPVTVVCSLLLGWSHWSRRWVFTS